MYVLTRLLLNFVVNLSDCRPKPDDAESTFDERLYESRLFGRLAATNLNFAVPLTRRLCLPVSSTFQQNMAADIMRIEREVSTSTSHRVAWRANFHTPAYQFPNDDVREAFLQYLFAC